MYNCNYVWNNTSECAHVQVEVFFIVIFPSFHNYLFVTLCISLCSIYCALNHRKVIIFTRLMAS